MLGCAFAYLVCGIITADLARSASSVHARSLWRLAGWAISAVVFGSQLIIENRKVRGDPLRLALHSAAAVALGAFLLAAAGPMRTHWLAGDRSPVAILSLVVWPLVTGVPAFLVAYGIGAVVRARARHVSAGPSWPRFLRRRIACNCRDGSGAAGAGLHRTPLRYSLSWHSAFLR